MAFLVDWDTFGKPSSRGELNGGVLVLRPNASLVPMMVEATKHMTQSYTLEQSFLSRYFDWQTLPPIYNSPASLYLRNPTMWSFARVIHYTHAKPWQRTDQRFEIWHRGAHELWWRAFEDMQRGYTYSPLESSVA